MRLFAEVVDDGGAAVIWADDAWCERAHGSGASAVARRVHAWAKPARTIRLLARKPGPPGTGARDRASADAVQGHAAADRRLPGGQRARRRRAGAGDRRRAGADRSTRSAGCSRCAGGSSARRSPRAARRSMSITRTRPTRSARRSPRCGRMSTGRLITVFGAGGDRDMGKRAQMGEVAAAHSEWSSSPTTTRAARIRRRSALQVLAGAPGAREIGDRRAAIARGDRRGRRGRHRADRRQGPRAGPDRRLGRGDARAAVRRRDGRARMRRRTGRSQLNECGAQDLALADRAIATASGWRCGPRTRSPRRPAALPAARSRRPGSRWIRATCARATCSSRSRARAIDGHLYRRQGLRQRRRRGGGRAADRRSRTCWSRTPRGRLSVSRKAARERACGARHRGHRLGRQDRGQGSDLRRARPLEPRRRAPLGAQLQQPRRRAAEPVADARAQRRFGVFEMGMNHAGEILGLTAQVRPHVAVITTIAPAHIENLGSEEAIADAKAEIFAGLEPGGTAVIPADSPHFARLRAAAAMPPGREVLSFGRSAGCRMSACSMRSPRPTAARWSPPRSRTGGCATRSPSPASTGWRTRSR